MKLNMKDLPADLCAKIEKVMQRTGKTWGDSVILLLQKVVSPKPRFVKA